MLLLSAVLFACRQGVAILHALGVLLLSAALTLYALGRRMRRRLSAAPRVCAALAALGAAALAALLWPSSLAARLALLSGYVLQLQLQLQLLSAEPAVSAVVAGAAASALLHLSLSLYCRATAAAPLVEVKARQAGALVGDHSRHRLRGKRGLQPKLLPSAVAEVWQLHKDGLLLQAAELLSEIESQSGAGFVMESAGAMTTPAGPTATHQGVTSARRELAKHADLVAEIKSREEATLIALQAFEGAAAPSKM